MVNCDLISVIIPIYNAEKYLEACIAAIGGQSYENFELLLIDDGSTDRSPEICDRAAREDARIRVIHKKNGGSASARNVGLKEVKGSYLAFVDADDVISPDYLKVLHDCAVSGHADLVQCGFQSVQPGEAVLFPDNNGAETKKYSNIQLLQDFCSKKTYLSVAVLWNKLYKKDLWLGLTFPEGKGIDDEFLVCQVVYRAETVLVTDAVLYSYYLSPNSQMRSKPSLKKLDNQYALEQQLAFFREIGHMELYNALLYRYYSVISGSYFFLKEYFPEEKARLQELKKKKKGILKTMTIREIPLSDRCLLLVRGYCPGIFNMVHKMVKKS